MRVKTTDRVRSSTVSLSDSDWERLEAISTNRSEAVRLAIAAWEEWDAAWDGDHVSDLCEDNEHRLCAGVLICSCSCHAREQS